MEKIPVSRIFLFSGNPRHEPNKTEDEAIKYLCNEEGIYPLAEDIARNGLNPTDKIALFPANKNVGETTFYVADGNRRICALKLLNDPERAPVALRKKFEKVASTWTPISFVDAVNFESYEDVRVWLERNHNGEFGGVGRVKWNSDQVSRFDKNNKNRAAQSILDYAENEGFINSKDRKRKLTTVQRFIDKDVFSRALGVIIDNPDDIIRFKEKSDFDIRLKFFIKSLVNKEINSRKNKTEIIEYSQKILSINGINDHNSILTSIKTGNISTINDEINPIKPKKPNRPQTITADRIIQDQLENLDNYKIWSLYYSICKIDLKNHCVIINIGIWSFLDSLTAILGRLDNVPFKDFCSKQKLNSYNITGRNQTTINDVLERLSKSGNSAKHHPTAASFNGEQLNNDFTTLKTLIQAMIEEAIQNKISISK